MVWSDSRRPVEVLDLWRFEPASDSEMCVPKETPVQLSLWFEGTTNDPQIAVTLPKRRKTTQSVPASFPNEARLSVSGKNAGIEGQSQGIDPGCAGRRRVICDGAVGTAGGGFDYVARRTALQWSSTWKDAPDKPYCLLKTYLFCMESAKPGSIPVCGIARRTGQTASANNEWNHHRVIAWRVLVGGIST